MNIWNKLRSWSHIDKLMHFGIAAGMSALLCYFDLWPIAIFVSWAVAGGKEMYDNAHPEAHTFDGWDAYWTLAGGNSAVVVSLAYPTLTGLIR